MNQNRRRFCRCPRCGAHAFEFLKTHCHCAACNYFPEDDAKNAFHTTSPMDFKQAMNDFNEISREPKFRKEVNAHDSSQVK